MKNDQSVPNLRNKEITEITAPKKVEIDAEAKVKILELEMEKQKMESELLKLSDVTSEKNNL